MNLAKNPLICSIAESKKAIYSTEMNLSILNTLLNTAPSLIQGANQLYKIIKQQRDKQSQSEEDVPEFNIESEIQLLKQRLDNHSEANLEQTRLIEELAKQNASIAEQLKSTASRLQIISIFSLIALLLAITAFIFR